VACQRKALALLGLLAVAGERGLSRDRLLAYLWPETATDRASHRLTQLLYSIRRDFQADQLFLGTAELRLNPALLTSDIATFTAAFGRADFATAVSAYGGHFLDGFFLDDAPEFERWVDGERTRLAHRYGEVLEALALAAERGGDQAAAAEWWRRRVDCEPLNGRAVARCMEALDCVGERGEALRLARAHEQRMREDLDISPDPEVQAIVARLRAQRAPAALMSKGSSLAPVTSVAVLPFVNLSPDREGEYFSDGLTDELIDALGRVPGLKVAARTSVFAFKGMPLDVTELGARLGAGSLIEGTVRLVGRRVRLAVRLIDAAENCQRWSETYERTLDDVFAMQAELAGAVVAALPLSTPAAKPATPPATQDAEAYDLFLRGRYSVLKRTPKALALAVEYFEQAVERDPLYAVAYSSLAEAWVLSGFPEYGTVPPLEAMPKARTAALQAQRLDPSLAEPYLWIGAVRMLFDWDLPGAAEAFRKAQELRPEAAYTALWCALHLSVSRKYEEAIRVISRARSLEPLSLNIQIGYVRICIYAGHFEEAVREAAALHAAEPDDALVTVWLAQALVAAGRAHEAVDLLDVMPATVRKHRTSYVDSLQIIALVTAGARQAAEQLAEQRKYIPAGPVEVRALLLLGRIDQAVAVLERLIRERSGVLMFLGSPIYSALYAEPRTAALLRRIGVPLE
jgi:serine/threonine-protein kinase